jgi:hypothetical protein
MIMAYPNYYNGGYYPQYQNGAVPDMLNQYKGQYQQMPMQQPMVQQMQTPTQTNDMIWVLNENEATSYPVAPNNSVVLWDKNEPIIYVKSVNNQGMPSMRVLYFEERNATTSNSPKNAPKTHECTCGDKYATKEQINALEGKIDDITAKYEELSKSIVEKPKTTTKKSKESEE